MIVDKLDQMQIKPVIDIDGSVYFQKDNNDFYVEVDPNVKSRPFLITMYYGSAYESDDEGVITKKNLADVMPSLNRDLNNVKIILEDDYYLIRTEMYANSAVSVSKNLEDICSAIKKIHSEDYFNKLVEAHKAKEQEQIEQIEENAQTNISVPLENSSYKVHFNMRLVTGYVGNDEVRRNFRIAETETTRSQWNMVMHPDSLSCQDENKDYPISSVSYEDVLAFIDSLNLRTGKHFRLPTPEEWIYAAKGGEKGAGNDFKYAGGNTPNKVAVFFGPEGNSIHRVKSKYPNELGLYDMSGNVAEMTSAVDDEKVVIMGGSCYGPAVEVDNKSAALGIKSKQKWLGFRLVMDIE